jgi:hypothetical protein
LPYLGENKEYLVPIKKIGHGNIFPPLFCMFIMSITFKRTYRSTGYQIRKAQRSTNANIVRVEFISIQIELYLSIRNN